MRSRVRLRIAYKTPTDQNLHAQSAPQSQGRASGSLSLRWPAAPILAEGTAAPYTLTDSTPDLSIH